jgi:predicted N-formylglutamate amidohydrolase
MTELSPPPFELQNRDAVGSLLFLCDHAGNQVPEELGLLGLPEENFSAHIAYDIGAGALTRRLATRFGAFAILGRFSRLVVDLNRGEDDPTSVMRLSDGRIIPGNGALDEAGIARRLLRYHAPYHAEIAARIERARAGAVVPVLVSIHSFTPVWRGRARPWHIGILWDRDARLARPLMERLARDGDIRVGDNEPYSGRLENDCLYRHSTMNGLPHVLIEVRQDLIADDSGIALWSGLLESALKDALDAMGPATISFTRPLRPGTGETAMDETTRSELEAAAFRRLVAHLRSRTDVQNIDMMNLAGFCRNCLGDWYREAAAEKGIALAKDEAREIVYGMAPAEWKKRYQTQSTPEQQAQFAKAQKTHS